MHKRWVVVIENFACLSPERFTYENYASLGAAQDARNRVNAQALRHNWRIRASIKDNKRKG